MLCSNPYLCFTSVALLSSPFTCLSWVVPVCPSFYGQQWCLWSLDVNKATAAAKCYAGLWLCCAVRFVFQIVFALSFALWCIVCRVRCTFLWSWPAMSVWMKWLLSRHYLGMCSLAYFCTTFNYAFKGRVNLFVAFAVAQQTELVLALSRSRDGIWSFCFSYVLYCEKYSIGHSSPMIATPFLCLVLCADV